MNKIKYQWSIGRMCNDAIVNECSLLYSNNYGLWSDNNSCNLNGQVKLSSQRIRKMLFKDDTDLYYAVDSDNNKIVGYAIALRKNIKNYGIVSWVTQLVVHEKYRNKGIAKNLLFSIWGLSNDYAWGIITSNPYAVRALEKATRRRSVPIRIKRNIKKIISIGNDNIDYINKDIEVVVDESNSKVNTKFFVSHARLAEKMLNVISDETPWLLGDLEEGWEWIAFTFNDQDQISLTQGEIQEMLNTSDDIVKLAYSRMLISSNQKWTNHTKKEVDFILKHTDISPGKTIIDFGCGRGRHAIALKKLGYKVFAVDYIKENIEYIKNQCMKLNDKIMAIVDDCRYLDLNIQADMVLCLYDVVGSFSDVKDNILILKNIFRHLKKGGVAFISVMNFELTNHIAKYKFSLKSSPNKLLNLNASNIMETTGDVFNPEFMLIDNDEHLVYRKEQFSSGRELPVELIVRDKRFSMEEIVDLCRSVGFTVEFAYYVSASDWNTQLFATDLHAKEILLKCIK